MMVFVNDAKIGNVECSWARVPTPVSFPICAVRCESAFRSRSPAEKKALLLTEAASIRDERERSRGPYQQEIDLRNLDRSYFRAGGAGIGLRSKSFLCGCRIFYNVFGTCLTGAHSCMLDHVTNGRKETKKRTKAGRGDRE
ncbi:hypothetical protein MRX96_052590 [Rhipicephalus microplus]